MVMSEVNSTIRRLIGPDPPRASFLMCPFCVRAFLEQTKQKIPICRYFTGATGLEPATSGLAASGLGGIGVDSRREQGFPTLRLRESPAVGDGLRWPPAGSARDAPLSFLQTKIS